MRLAHNKTLNFVRTIFYHDKIVVVVKNVAMKKNQHKKYQFTTVSDQLKQTYTLNNLTSLVNDLNELTELIHSQMPELRTLCHCGAIDYANDLLVIYVANNAAYYIVNNWAATIDEILRVNGHFFAKLYIKVRPHGQANQRKVKHQLSDEQYEMLKKFAVAIERPELIKERMSSVIEDELESETWKVDL